MKVSEIRDLSEKERGDKVRDLQEELFNLKFQVATGKIEDPSRLRLLRRDIAKVKTVQREQASKAKQGAGDGQKQETAVKS